jgi:hypothetical protein
MKHRVLFRMSSRTGKVRDLPLCRATSLTVSTPGTAHGFALRPNLALPDLKTAYEGALEQTAAWFEKTLSYQVFLPVAID